METIAVYSEVRFEGSRTFTLFPDKVAIRGKQTLQFDFETVIPLATLNPDPDKIWFRSPISTAGLVITILSYIGLAVLVSGFHIPFATFAPTLVTVIGISGTLLMLATIRKVEFFRFKNDGGIVILDLARAGKNSSQIDSFVDLLIKQIRIARVVA